MTTAAPVRRGPARLRRAPAALLTAVLLWSCAESPPEPPRFSNLVLIVIDTLRSDHLASYGYSRQTAPFLDVLANEGIQVHGMAASSWTKPAVATLLTGLFPQRHQTNTRAAILPGGLPFLPEILQRRGFSTLGYTANWFTGPSFGFDRGFDRFLEVWPPESLEGEMYRNPASPDKPHASWATDSALDLVADAGSPFFLSVHYLDPHDPYTPPAAWGEEPTPPSEFVQPGDLEPETAEATSVGQLVDQYDAVIRELDGEIRRLVDGLRASGLLEQTLVVVTSDHGEEFLEHGGFTHGKTLFEEVLRVPLLFWSADGLEPRRSDTRFHHVDLLPTLLQALGLEAPEILDGAGRWRELAAGGLPQPAESLHHLDLDGTGALAIGAPPWKLVHQKHAGAREGEATATNLLFHLASDPGERVHREGDSTVREDLLRRLIDRHNELAGEAGEARLQPLDEDLRRNLAGLGYLDASTPQEELEKRTVPDRLRFFDARTWGLFAGGSDRDPVERVETGKAGLARRIARLPRGIDGSGPDKALHWVLLRPEGSTRVILEGESSRGTGPVTCRFTIDGAPTVLELTGHSWERSFPLPAVAAVERTVYLDLSCTVTPEGDDGLGRFERLAVRVD